MNKIGGALLIVFIGAWSHCTAQFTGEPAVYTLNDCLKIAEQSNVDVQLANAQIQSANADLTAAFGTFLPSIAGNFGYNRRLNVDGGGQINVGGFAPPPNNYSMSITANYTLFDGFSREARFRASGATLTSTELSARQTLALTRLTIWRQFIAVQRNSQALKTRLENLKMGELELSRVKARHEAGVIAISAVYAQEADNGQRELLAVQAENQLNLAKAALLTTMGLNPSVNAEFVQTEFPDNVTATEAEQLEKEIGSYQEAVQKAEGKRPDLSAAIAQKKSSEATATSAQSGYYPSISARGGWSWANSEFNRFDIFGQSFIGLNLSIPIFENFNANANIQRAQLGVKQSELRILQAEQQIRSDIQLAFLNIQAAKKQLQITERSLISVQMNFDAAKERYSVGSGNATDYLLANSQLVNAKIERVNAVYAFFEAKAQALYATGVLQ